MNELRRTFAFVLVFCLLLGESEIKEVLIYD